MRDELLLAFLQHLEEGETPGALDALLALKQAIEEDTSPSRMATDMLVGYRKEVRARLTRRVKEALNG